MKNIIIMLWQIMTYFIVGVPLRIIYRVKRKRYYFIDKSKKYVFVANHRRILDPFIITYSLPFMDFLKLVPIRFITADRYMKNVFLRYFLLLYGCISAAEHKGISVLQRAKRLLLRGETLFIFPKGKLTDEKEAVNPKVGANYLERELSDVLLFPVKISYKRSVLVEYKEPFRHSDFGEDLSPLAIDTYNIIMNKNYLKKSGLYELEWSINDNPNGWLEPTTYCQLKCPGCYRGLAEENPIREHEDLEKMKEEVDWMIKHRNVQSISIAGGEPLMYPKIDELIEYIYSKGLKTKIFTNGIVLNENKLKMFKEKGATEFVIHIDKYQRTPIVSESVILKKREEYCDMFRRVGGVNLGFIMPLSSTNLSDLPLLAEFYKKNSDIVNLVVFTTLKEMLPDKKLDEELALSIEDASHAIKESFNLSYCAYIGKNHSERISWLFAMSSYHKGRSLGSFNGNFYRDLQKRYYGYKKKYFITIRNKPLDIYKLIPSMLNLSVMKILLKSFFAGAFKINNQVVLIIDAPEHNNGIWEICSSCPDAMLYNGKLVPSCLLERVKKGEEMMLK